MSEDFLAAYKRLKKRHKSLQQDFEQLLSSLLQNPMQGRLCLQCGSDKIRIWDQRTCPKCQGRMEETGEKEFWT